MDLTLFISLLSAVLSGVLVLILYERFDEKYSKPVRCIIELRRRIISALTMYAHFYMNPNLQLNAKEEARKSEAAWDVRRLASELDGAVSSIYQPNPSAKGIQQKLERVREYIVRHVGRTIPSEGALRLASRHLIGLSNSFFASHRGPNDIDPVERNEDIATKIRELLTKRFDNPLEIAKYQ